MTVDRLAVEVVDDFAELGIVAFTTGRSAGSFGTASDEPVSEVMARWRTLRDAMRPFASRLATATQVHGARVVLHDGEWQGWLRADAADGHAAFERGTAMAISVADCVPVFLGHPSGAAAILHAGWRGTAAGILRAGVEVLRARGIAPAELRLHLGPAICGDCYEVSPDVYRQVTGTVAVSAVRLDLRAVLADQASAAGITRIGSSGLCTRCDASHLFSHRRGDIGRQLAVIAARRDIPIP